MHLYSQVYTIKINRPISSHQNYIYSHLTILCKKNWFYINVYNVYDLIFLSENQVTLSLVVFPVPLQ